MNAPPPSLQLPPTLQDESICNSKSGNYFSLPICFLYKNSVGVCSLQTVTNLTFISPVLYQRVKMHISDRVFNVALFNIPLTYFYLSSSYRKESLQPLPLFYHLSQRLYSDSLLFIELIEVYDILLEEWT